MTNLFIYGAPNTINPPAGVQAPTMVDLRLIPVTGLANGAQAYLQGYYAASDGGEGQFHWNSSSTGSDNSGTIILPTGQSSGTPGRWIRDKQAFRDMYPVRWYGAKGDGATNDTNAINFAITDAQTTKPISTAINKVYFSGGTYMSDGHVVGYTDCMFVGSASLITRWTHRNGNAKPLIYWTGGTSTTAAPYGGCTGIRLGSGDSTFPAIMYMDTMLDNQWNWDDCAFGGSSSNTSICDGFSFFDFLNAKARSARADAISGYAVRIRGNTCKATLATNSGGVYKATVNAGTDIWTYTANNTRLVPGTAVMAFTTGTLPTVTATGVALVAGPAGGVYFAGNTTETTMQLFTTAANAKANTSPVLYDDAGSGTHGFATFPANFAVTSIDTAADSLTFTNDKNIIIATAVAESGKTVTYGTGYTGSGTIVSGGAGAAGGIHAVFLFSDGTLPTGISAGTAYYPIYVSPTSIKLATTVSNAVAGTAIDLVDSGSGNITILYDHQASQLGIGGFEMHDFTYDNASCGTIETVNSVACGGLGVMFADYSDFDYKGAIVWTGNRIEINKMIARDAAWGNNTRALFRVNTSGNAREIQAVRLLIKAMVFDFTASIASSQASMVRIVGNRGNLDIAPAFERVNGFGGVTPYDNDYGTAKSRILGQIGSKRWALDNVSGNQAGQTNLGRLDGQGYGSIMGKQTTPYNTSQANNSFTKPQDFLISNDAGVVWYYAAQTNEGWSAKADGTLSIGATVTGTTGSAVFTLSTTPTQANFCNGVSVVIAGAGAASANLTGIVQQFDVLSATKTFVLGDSSGNLNPCLTDVAGAAVTYSPAIFAQVGAKYVTTATLDFGNITTLLSADLDISAPTGITFTAGKVVNLGLPSNVTAGMVYNAFVKAGGGAVTVRATNTTVGSINPSSGTFAIEVAV